MNVFTKLENTMVYIRTSYMSSVFLLHKLMWLVNQISDQLEPKKCIVHGQIGIV